MTAIVQQPRVQLVRYGIWVEKEPDQARRPLVQSRMIVSVSLILGALVLVFLMLLGWVPVTFFTAFLGFAMAAAGGTMCLIFCGEI